MMKEEAQEIIKLSKLSLQTLLLNIKADEKVLVENVDDALTYMGNEKEIRDAKPEWLDIQVANIYFDRYSNMIKIEISNNI